MSNFKVDKQAKYTQKHEWVRLEEGLAVVGVSDAGQDLLSDVVYVELPEVGRTVSAGQELAVVEINDSLVDTPELVNQRPYSSWFFKLEPTATLDSELAALMDVTAYEAFVDANVH